MEIPILFIVLYSSFVFWLAKCLWISVGGSTRKQYCRAEKSWNVNIKIYSTWSNFNSFLNEWAKTSVGCLKSVRYAFLMSFWQRIWQINKIPSCNCQALEVMMFGLVPHTPTPNKRTKSKIGIGIKTYCRTANLKQDC